LESLGNTFGYECTGCGQYHVGMPSFGWDWPAHYLGVPEAEREQRIVLTPDACVIDSQWFYVRGCLDVPVHGHRDPFTWGAWVSMSHDDFLAYAELHDAVNREPGARFVGWLSTAIPGYPDTTNMPAALNIRPWPTRPFIELKPTAHPLAVEQREGITPVRVQEIAERVMHPPARPD
jgi:hypothetical protein